MTSHSLQKTLLLGATVAAAGLLAAGCAKVQPQAGGPGAGSPTPQQAVLLAARHAEAVNSVSATFSVQTSGLVGVSMSGSVAEQIRPHLLVNMNVTSMQMTGQSMPGGFTLLATDKAFYLKSSAFGAATDGKPWIEVRLSDMGNGLGLDFSKLLQQAENSDPLAQAKLLAGASDVRKVGTGTINGVPVTEYTGHITMADALAKLPADMRQQLQQQIAKAGVSTADFTVWLDDQQQPRKLIMVEHGGSLSLTVTLVVTSINQPVSVQLPAGSQVKIISASDLGAGS